MCAVASSLVTGFFGSRTRPIVSEGKWGCQESRKWTGMEAKGLALGQTPAKKTALNDVFSRPLLTRLYIFGSVNTLLSAHRGDPEGPSERRQHSPAAERSHGAALHQPHVCNHGNHLS